MDKNTVIGKCKHCGDPIYKFQVVAHDGCVREYEFNPDYLDFQKGVEVSKELCLARIGALIEEIEDLIIGVDGCKFEERLDGDKGCLVLDMNQNQWDEFKATHTSRQE